MNMIDQTSDKSPQQFSSPSAQDLANLQQQDKRKREAVTTDATNNNTDASKRLKSEHTDNDGDVCMAITDVIVPTADDDVEMTPTEDFVDQTLQKTEEKNESRICHEDIYPQSKANELAKKIGGIQISRDKPGGGAKWFYVFQNPTAAYNVVFQQEECKRDFYEVIPPNTPVRLTFDFDLPRKKVCKKSGKVLWDYDGQDVHQAMNVMEKEVVQTATQILQDKYHVSVDESQILSLTSDGKDKDGKDKASRHVIFPIWFDCWKTSMQEFVQQDVMPMLTETTLRCVDKNIYTDHRSFRFFGNTKIGSERRLHYAPNPDLQPFTDEHRAIFDSALVQAPAPEGVVPIHIDSTSAPYKPRIGQKSVPRHTFTESSGGSDAEQCKRYLLREIPDLKSLELIYETTLLANGCLQFKTYSKYCLQIDGYHKSNHVNYIVGRSGIRQSCFNADCLLSNSEWKAWPSPRPDFANRLFFARPPQNEIKGKRVPPSRSQVFLDWTMTSQPMDPMNRLSGDVVPDFFWNAPFDLYAKDIYGFLKLREMFSCGSDGDFLPTIPNEFLELAKKHNDWLETMKRALTSRGQETYFVVRYLDEEEKVKPKKEQINYMYLFRTNPTADVFVDALKKWQQAPKNKPKLHVFDMFRTAPVSAMLDYYAEIKERLVQQVNPLTSPVGREKRRLYDVLISAGVDVQFGAVLEDDMLLKLLLHIVDEDRWARQAVMTFDKQSGRLECPVLKYNPKTRVYDKRFDCLNDFCIHVLCKLRVDTDYCASKYLASNPRVMNVLLRSLEQKWAPLQPDRRYVAFKDGIYDRFCVQDDGALPMGRFYPDGSTEYQAVVNNTEQDIYRFFDIPYGASPTDMWNLNNIGKTVAAMKPKYTGETATVIDKILQYQGLSFEDCFVIWAAAGRSMLGLMHEEKRIDGLKLSLYFDGESDTGKTIVLDILSHAHPDEQIGAFSEEKSFPMATAVHRGILVNHESNQMIVPFTIWRNVCEGVDVAAAIKYGAAFYGIINAMIVGAGNGVCMNYPDTGGAKSARLLRAPMTRTVQTKDSTLLDQAKNSYGVIMHKAISAYWTWVQCCVKKGTWYASLSKESVLYGREAKSRHHLMERFIAERMNVIGFKDRVKETLKFRNGIPTNIDILCPTTAPERAPDSDPRVALQDFADLYYNWVVTLAEGDDFENPYESKVDCIEKCFNPADKKLNTNLGQNFFWNKYHCIMKKNKLGSKKKSEHVIYGMSGKQAVLYPMPK